MVNILSGAGPGVSELTNQSRLGVEEKCLKETITKTECFRQCSSMRKLKCFLSIKAFIKPASTLVVPENEHNMSPLMLMHKTLNTAKTKTNK